MKFSDVSLPEIYQTSADFRFFCKWFETALSQIHYNTEHVPNLYDPLKCPSELLWMLADTMGFKYDDRLPPAYNRLVLLYFMSMIRNRGSKDGVTLAAEVNLAQFNILDYAAEDEILNNRLDDTSIPVNSVYVTPHVADGYIDVVYFSSQNPIDACIEYVRPLGMYLFSTPGVRFDSRTKVSIDARLTNISDAYNTRTSSIMSNWITHVGHYTRNDFAKMQKVEYNNDPVPRPDNTDVIHYGAITGSWQGNLEATEDRNEEYIYYRNSKYEGEASTAINPGLRALSSLQLCNNEHIMRSLRVPIFGLGYTPNEDESYVIGDNDDIPDESFDWARNWNLRYDKVLEFSESDEVHTVGMGTPPNENYGTPTAPRPAVNPIMMQVGDAISLNSANTQFSKVQDDGTIVIDTPT